MPQTRTTAMQGEIVRLYFKFLQDGILADPYGQPLVEIINSDGALTLDVVPTQIENTGLFYADWFVPETLPLGDYYDRWSFQWDTNSGVKEETNIFSVSAVDTYINFISTATNNQLSNRASQLLRDLSNDFIFESMFIPNYFEQGMRVKQEHRELRTKSYYFFTLDADTYTASRSAIYGEHGQSYIIFEDLENIHSSSSSSSESGTSSSSTESVANLSSSSSSSPATSSSSTSSEGPTTTTTTTYGYQPVLIAVGTGNPHASGTLTKISGDGSDTINYTSYEKKVSHFSTTYNFAYKNWNRDPRPIVRLNTRIVEDGWYSDFNGNLYFDSLMSPEDRIEVAYNFSYFSNEELLSFLNLGLGMMNGLPPSSETYGGLVNAPAAWNPGILLYAAITALKRLIFGLNFQEKRIIFGTPEDAERAQKSFESLYQTYNELWVEFGKNVKTRKLPDISQYVTPEYTLPGGRSRWFRYLYKSGA